MKKLYFLIIFVFSLNLLSGQLLSEVNNTSTRFTRYVELTIDSHIYNGPSYKTKTSIKVNNNQRFELVESANEFYYKVRYNGGVKYIKKRHSKLISSFDLTGLPVINYKSKKRPSVLMQATSQPDRAVIPH
ncbi:MAG: hypothetical protein AAF901_09415 [Bacteroidota bacterium]